MRLFIALELPERVRERLFHMAGGVPGARWVPPGNMHVTVRFIGDVDGARFADIVDALGEVHKDRFTVRLGGLGRFGEGRRTRVLWAGLAPSAELERLHGKIEAALVRSGVEPDHRKFHPHVTLARLKAAKPGRVADFLAAHDGLTSEDIAVDRFVLYSSLLGSEGAVYRPEAVYLLDPPPAMPA